MLSDNALHISGMIPPNSIDNVVIVYYIARDAKDPLKSYFKSLPNLVWISFMCFHVNTMWISQKNRFCLAVCSNPQIITLANLEWPLRQLLCQKYKKGATSASVQSAAKRSINKEVNNWPLSIMP